ncbi:MAG: alkaline phosphatase family protein [Solirubrobacteraceae bacterium]
MTPVNDPASLTRRTLLRGAAGGAALLAGGGLPAWARPVAGSAAGVRRPDSLPFPHRPAGHPSMPEIEHIVVLMMENHSFDNVLGMVGHEVPGRADVDGLTRRHGRVTNVNRDTAGRRVYARRAASPCQLNAVPSQAWNASHTAYAGGRNSGFVKASGDVAMEYWDRHDLPFTYSLARHFPIGERYFCSVLAQTYPNRRFFFAGTSSGTVDDKTDAIQADPANGTIFDRLDQHAIHWGIYYESNPSIDIIITDFKAAWTPRINKMDRFYTDAAAGHLPSFTFLDPNYGTTSEENPQDIQVGERFVASVVNALMRAPTWHRTALFLTYDEHGGYYDHVPPPRAIRPDSIAPIHSPNTPPLAPGTFNRYGFRVPTIVVSPWAKPGYVSRVVQDHTSITSFVRRKWNLPAMTFRDANAAPMTDYFNFKHAAFAKPPKLAAPPSLGPGLAACHAAGLTPPL